MKSTNIGFMATPIAVPIAHTTGACQRRSGRREGCGADVHPETLELSTTIATTQGFLVSTWSRHAKKNWTIVAMMPCRRHVISK